jgi:4-hydroxybenzoate polyprenyltransferase
MQAFLTFDQERISALLPILQLACPKLQLPKRAKAPKVPIWDQHFLAGKMIFPGLSWLLLCARLIPPKGLNPNPLRNELRVKDADGSAEHLETASYQRSRRSPIAPLLPILRLMRLPNVFTAVSDVLMGFVFTRHSFSPGGALACLVLASAMLYIAGMVLNDVFDLEVDKKERPFRPLPSGQIAVAQARALGFVLLLLGVGFGWLAGFLYQNDPILPFAHPWRSGAVATMLAVAVLLYDAILKKTPFGPFAMGLCRLLNVLLGMSLAGAAPGNEVSSWLGYTYAQWLIAAGLGLYVVGITIYAKSEAEAKSQTAKLLLGVAVMLAGVCVMGLAALFTKLHMQPNYLFWALLALLTVTILRRAVAAAFDGSSILVQGAVKHAILSIIMLDAAVCLASGPPVYAIVVVMLLGPAVLLGKWVYST